MLTHNVNDDLGVVRGYENKLEPQVIELPYKYTPREYQEEVFDKMVSGSVKRGILVWHRRAGKDKTVFNIMATLAATTEPAGLYLYFLPTSTQAKKVIWRGRGKDGVRFVDHINPALIKNINNTEMMVELINGSIIQLGGADNYDAFMGTNPLGIVFSEYSIQDPAAWDYFRPILAENNGWALFDYTPRGRNHGYFLLQNTKNNPKWYTSVLTANDTFYTDENGVYRNVITQEAIQDEIDSGMDPDMVDQEFYCNFDSAIKGAYYGKEIKKAWDDKRICRVPIQPGYPTYTYWDLGFNDQTAIWFVQFWGEEIRVINYYSNAGEGFSHYLAYVNKFAKEHDVTYEEHWGPHDIAHHEFMSGQTRRKTAKEMGLTFQTMQRPKDKNAAIEAGRLILPRCVFDEKRCEHGINALTSYQHRWDEENKVFLPRPLHNWASNGADAFQYLALSFRKKVEETKAPVSHSYSGEGSWLGS